jgi:hypothetical protein
MMNVPIDNEHTLGLVSVLRMTSRDRHAIKEAKAHSPRRASVMPGWSNNAKRIACLAGKNCIDSGNRAPGGNAGAEGALRADRRIAGAELAAMLRDFALDKLDVFTCVSECEVVIGRRARRDLCERRQPAHRRG